MQLEKSENLKFVMQLSKQETTFHGNLDEYDRLKHSVQEHLKHKIKDSLFQSQKRTGTEASFWSATEKVHQRERAEITAKEEVQKIVEIACTG